MLHRISFSIAIAAMLAAVGFSLAKGEGAVGYWLDRWFVLFGDIDHQMETLEKKHGLSIEYDMGSEAIPDLWRQAPAFGTGSPISREGLSRYIRLLEKELVRYPSDVIKRTVSAVYLFDSLSFYGVPYGGTTLGNALYLTICSRNTGCNYHYLASLFHHEMSSVLLGNYDFPEQEWRSINPDGFSYYASDADVLQSIASNDPTDGNDELYRQGFLSSYGHSTLENDVNIYAEMLFTQPERICELAKAYPRVRRKFEIVKRFYHCISTEFSFPLCEIGIDAQPTDQSSVQCSAANNRAAH